LIRSKGVGVFFVTQNPLDVPETVLGQLGNRVQHALRAFTPRDQKAVNTAASTLRANPKIKTEQAITELGVGEALVSLLDEKGTPSIVERAWILPPASRIGAITPAERAAVINASGVKATYDQLVDRESAYEKLRARTANRQGDGRIAAPSSSPGAPAPTPAAGGASAAGSLSSVIFGTTGPRGGHHEGLLEVAAKSATRAISSGAGRQILRGVLGSIFGGAKR
jgi:hypothetical protein